MGHHCTKSYRITSTTNYILSVKQTLSNHGETYFASFSFDAQRDIFSYRENNATAKIPPLRIRNWACEIVLKLILQFCCSAPRSVTFIRFINVFIIIIIANDGYQRFDLWKKTLHNHTMCVLIFSLLYWLRPTVSNWRGTGARWVRSLSEAPSSHVKRGCPPDPLWAL